MRELNFDSDLLTRDEALEEFALDNLECYECEVSLAKISAGDYYCPSCGLRVSE
jgi:hypothetical protein